MNKKFPDPPARLHLIGIKGQGMVAVAQILHEQGYVVTGSDVADIFPTDAVLERLAVPVIEEFSAANIGGDVEAVIYSTAYQATHPERMAAKKLGVPEWSYPEIINLFFKTHARSVAVAGSHGKTTTTSLLGHMLEEGGFDPTIIVGSVDGGWKTNARVGRSEWFVFEADEYQNKFEHYEPRHILLTNVDYDHPDYFPNRQAYEKVFLDFVSKLPTDGKLVVWGDDPLRPALQKKTAARVETYGESTGNDWLVDEIDVSSQGTSFVVLHQSKNLGRYTIPFAGKHYALNATGAMALAVGVGVKPEAIERALKYFRGTSRRMEKRGEYAGALVYDDYAHHPTEVAATIAALRSEYPKRRLVVVFHPHTFSRTEKFQDAFVASLAQADVVYLLPVYGSAREAAGKVSSRDLAQNLETFGVAEVRVCESIDECVKVLRTQLRADDVVVTMGAGDVWKVAAGLTG